MRQLALFLVLILVVPAPAQNSSTSKVTPLPTLRTEVRLVVVDVVVTDKNKQPVHGLQENDFQLFENNVSQTFRSFEEHVAASDAVASRVVTMPKMPPGVYTNYAPGPTDGPLNILLLDRLNTALADQLVMQKQLVEFLDRMKPGQRFAVFGLTDHLQYLQSFTSDSRILKAVVAGKGKAMMSSLLKDAVGSNTDPKTISSDAEDWEEMVVGDPDTPVEVAQEVQNTMAEMDQFQRMNTSFETQTRARYTLDALNLLARYLAAFPGRKNLVWFSGSFPVNILPSGKVAQDIANGTGVQDIGLNNPFAGVETLEREFRQTSALLSRSQVAVYPVAVKGLADAAMFYSETGSTGAADLRYSDGQGGLNDFAEENFSNNSTMFMMADDTGGKALINTNDLTGAIKNAMTDGANYYTIAYSPTDPRLDSTFRTILVKLRQSGYNVAYRRGYFAEDTERKQQPQGSKSPPTNAMQLALTHGGPNPMQLIFSAKVQAVSDVADTTVAKENKPTRRAGSGPFQAYKVSYAIDPRELQLVLGADGVRHDSLEFTVYVYDSEGDLINSVSAGVTASMTQAAYSQAQKVGVPFHQEVSVPEKGEYYIRIAVHDVKPDHVGAVEVPVDNVRNLAALEQGTASKPKPVKAGK